jgi:DNA-binding SARP family transcriptional activator
MSTWHLRLLGSLQAERDGQIITRFRSQKFAALLAYLAVFPRRTHSREELADLLWPDAEVEVGRSNLRTALSSLRRQLEPPGTPARSVLITEGRHHVPVNGEGIVADIAAFEKAVAEAGRPSNTREQRLKLWADAVSLYGGPFMPGFYDT